MNVNIESTSALRRKVTIEVDPDEIKRELDRTYNELRRGVVLKGFRPGHAPRNLLERFFGDQVRSDVIQRLVKEYTDKALDENNLKPVVEPEIVTEATDLPRTLKFSAVFDIRPEVVVKDYEGLKVPEENVEVADSRVDEVIEALRERQATLKKVEGRNVVQEGDVVLATVEAFEGEKSLMEGKVESRLLQVSKSALAHGVDEVLIGAEAGKEARATRSYPAEYDDKDLAGKTVEWRVTVKEIYERQLPALDDDFAKDQGDCQNLAELRERVRADLIERARAEADSRARQALLELIVERNPVEVPESMVSREQRAMEAELATTLRAGGLGEEQIAEQLRASAEEFHNRAVKRARNTLILDALCEQEHVEVDDEQLAERIGLILRQSGRTRERLADFYSHEENREALRRSMRREKVLEALLERARQGSKEQAQGAEGAPG
jgi:trigger factor